MAKSQIQKFREAARAAEAKDSEKRFDETLKALVKAPRKGAAVKNGSRHVSEEKKGDRS
jgi:hypothetical protein